MVRLSRAAAFACILLAVFFLGREFEKHSRRFHAVSGYIIPDARAVKIATLGFGNLASDIFSIQAVSSLYASDKSDPRYWRESVKAFKEYLKGRQYHAHTEKLDVVSFARYAYIASYLDPFDTERIELFTLIMDWVLGFPEGSIPILEYVSVKNAAEWRFPYYLALNYLIHKNDRERALYWLKEASLRPHALSTIKSFMIEVASHGDSRQNVLTGLSALREMVKDEEIKENIDKTIEFFKKGGSVRRVDWERIRQTLEKLRKEGHEEGYHHEEDGDEEGSHN